MAIPPQREERWKKEGRWLRASKGTLNSKWPNRGSSLSGSSVKDIIMQWNESRRRCAGRGNLLLMNGLPYQKLCWGFAESGLCPSACWFAMELLISLLLAAVWSSAKWRGGVPLGGRRKIVVWNWLSIPRWPERTSSRVWVVHKRV